MIKNVQKRRFGASSQYIVIQCQAPHDIEVATQVGDSVEKAEGENFYLAFTENEFVRACSRASQMSSDIEEFFVEPTE